ncbi:DUF3311 domain-containing protein [Halomontanus rarus]|uniref:DUF3311 domain-containing protein n=1 Tax=Halomontanus rarus TaxID=3034020 RepID=UPI001A992E7C
MDQGRDRSRDRDERRNRVSGRNGSRTGVLRWTGAAVVLVALSIPWFLWGNDTVVAGLPIWLWWHVGWMGLAAGGFWVFATRAWGVGIETGMGEGTTDAGEPAADTGGERR